MFMQTHRTLSSGREPTVSHRLWMILMCSCTFIKDDMAPLWQGMLIMEMAMNFRGTGGTWEILVPSLQFFDEPETALGKSNLEKNRKRQQKACLDGIMEFS